MTTENTQLQNPTQAAPSYYQIGLRARNIALVINIILFVVSILFILTAFQQPSLTMYIITGFLVVAWVASLITLTPVVKSPRAKIAIAAVLVHLVLFSFAVFVSDASLLASITALVFTIILASAALVGRDSDTAITLGIISSIMMAITGSFSSFPQITLSAVTLYLPALLGILVMLYLTLTTLDFLVFTLRLKLVVAILAVVLVPLMVQALFSNSFISSALGNQANDSLSFAAIQTANQVEDFLTRNQSYVSTDSSLPSFGEFLSLPPAERAGSQAAKDLILTIDVLKRRPQIYLSSYGLLDLSGLNVYDTNPAEIGRFETSNPYFQVPSSTGQTYTSAIEFDINNNDANIFFSAPIYDSKQKIVGVLRSRFDALVLQNLLESNTSLLGLRSYPVLLDENYIRLADAITPSVIYHSVVPLPPETLTTLVNARRLPLGVDAATLSTNLPDLQSKLSNSISKPYFTTTFGSAENEQIKASASVQLKAKPWVLVYSQEQAVLAQTLTRQNRMTVLISTIIASIIAAIATIIAQVISNPIIALTSTAQRVTSGDLEAQANIETTDEVRTLGDAFNLMTQRLRTFIGELEGRVQARTKELAEQNDLLRYRSRQIQTVSDVARNIASVQDLETLLTSVTRLISERFGFYHVGIFLVDETQEYAVLRAANSEGGRRMLARQHKLKVGQVGIVGFAAGRGAPRIATDVGADAVFFNNPDLPNTRSEMALPLKSGDQIIGVLDVQSTESNAFSIQDVELFTTLADQIAIAIINNRLYEETNRALEEAQSLHRQYLNQEWARELSERPHSAFVFTPQGMKTSEVLFTPEIEAVFDQGETISRPAGQAGQTAILAVPVLLRGEVIGIIHLQDQGEGRDWTEDEINTVQAVADQVGQALENARLVEQTIRRADRERRVLEITGKIRSTNDPQAMLQIAVDELQRALNASRTQVILNPAAVLASGTNEPSHENGSLPSRDNGHS